MEYYLMPLTKEESKDARKKGYRYAMENKSRWVPLGEAKEEVNTYDKGTTVLVYKGTAYNIHKDYVSIDEHFRVYIGDNMNLSTDIM